MRERRAMEYERLSSRGGAPSTQGRLERLTSADAYGGRRSQSCRFVARPPADDLGLSHGERLRLGRRAPPQGLPADQPFPPGGDGRHLSSRSRRFSSMRLFGCGAFTIQENLEDGDENIMAFTVYTDERIPHEGHP
ncbi:hypothetical protein BAE44_0016936 [Dichanthelium oligosanthes]|uniref:Uncharacterized protein n=1 Tax=Dichanthelium oligosanthes TaxID=888268 RepID=A0A1E5VA63_9POAL|nr:hypothetical protein BAE44_0016936 [Dichanthelium oligosanthes]